MLQILSRQMIRRQPKKSTHFHVKFSQWTQHYTTKKRKVSSKYMITKLVTQLNPSIQPILSSLFLFQYCSRLNCYKKSWIFCLDYHFRHVVQIIVIIVIPFCGTFKWYRHAACSNIFGDKKSSIMIYRFWLEK